MRVSREKHVLCCFHVNFCLNVPTRLALRTLAFFLVGGATFHVKNEVPVHVNSKIRNSTEYQLLQLIFHVNLIKKVIFM